MCEQAWEGKGEAAHGRLGKSDTGRGAKALSNTVKNVKSRRGDTVLVNREGTRLPDNSQAGVGGSRVLECAKIGKPKKGYVCLRTKVAKGNELASEPKVCMRKLKLSK